MGKGNTAAGGEITVVAGESTGGDGGAISFTTGHDKDGSTTEDSRQDSRVGQIQEILS